MQFTDTTAVPAVEPEIKKPDATLLAQLAELQKCQRSLDSLQHFLAQHHTQLLGLEWRVSVWNGEIVIQGPSMSFPKVPCCDIAARFPGEWNCSYRDYSTSGDYLDWLATRGQIKLRIAYAEKLAPSPVSPLIVNF